MVLVTVNLCPVLRQSAATLAPLQGGGPAILGIAVATTIMAPNYRILPMLNGGIPLWLLTLIFVVVDYALIAGSGAGVGVAHLSGGLMGFMYVRALQKGNDWSEWMHRSYNWFFNLFNPSKVVKQQRTREKVFYQADRKPFTQQTNVSQHRVDELLDKINSRGLGSLTDEEKEYLQRASQNLN